MRPRVYSLDGFVPVVDPSSFVHPSASLIGDVIVGPNCYIGPGASLRGDFGRLVVGAGANIQDNCIVHCFPGAEAVLGRDAHIGHGAVLHGCTVKENAMVGMNAVIMDGAVIGKSAFVAALAFVKAGFEVPPRRLAAGIPAKVLRELTDQEIEWKRQGTLEYQELARRCLAALEDAEALAAPEPGRRRFPAQGAKPLYKVKGG
ncbi:MAG: acyltransferase [Pseudomonadota bacterium]